MLNEACIENQIEKTKQLLEQISKERGSLDHHFHTGFTVVHSAACQGNWEILLLLLEHGGASVDSVDRVRNPSNAPSPYTHYTTHTIS